ncbi:MAG: ATP-binding cassette domain-containing protein [Caldilineaceae bacterium]
MTDDKHPPLTTRHSPLLEVRGLRKFFPIEKGFLRRVVGQVRAVDDVSFTIAKGQTLGLVGESGSGKTTLGRCILRAISPTAGQVLLHVNDQRIDVTDLSAKKLRPVRRHMQMVFQDPYSSLDPRKTILDIVGEPLRMNKVAKGRALEARVKELVEIVGLNVRYLYRYPHAFSGGQRQRIGLARALALNPELIVCDEPVSALDVSVQAQILNLFQDLQQEFNLTYLFIAHDLSVVQHIADRVAVMYVGQLVEMAETADLFSRPQHPYTEALLSAVPKPDPDRPLQEIPLAGEIASPSAPPSGCYFHPRCRYSDGARCQAEAPALREITPDHFVRCHYAESLSLEGIG